MRRQLEGFKCVDCLAWLTRAWTIVTLAMVLAEFFAVERSIPGALPLSYGILLFAYACQNAFRLWMRYVRGRRRGEWIYYGWWLTFLILFVISWWTKGRYEVTWTMVEVLLYTTMVFLGSALSKLLFLVRETHHARTNRPSHRLPDGVGQRR